MINSCGTGKPTEADGSGRGSGRKRRQLFGLFGCSAVRAVRLFGCSGCSAVRAVRLFGLFGCSGCSGCSAVRAVRAAAALLPRKAHWRAQRSPTEAGATATAAAAYLCAVVFLRLSPIGGSGEGKIHRCDGCCAAGSCSPY